MANLPVEQSDFRLRPGPDEPDAQVIEDGLDHRRVFDAAADLTKVRGEVAFYLSKDMGLSMAEIARNLGVGTSAIGMAIGRMKDEEKK